MPVGTYDVLEYSGSGVSLPALGDGRPGFAMVSFMAYPNLSTSTPGWSSATVLGLHRIAWVLWTGADDPASFAPTFASDGSIIWAAVSYLFDDPLATVVDTAFLPILGGGNPSGPATSLTITNADSGNTHNYPDEFLIWTVGAYKQCQVTQTLTGSISGAATSPLTNFVSAVDLSETWDDSAGPGQWLAGISHEAPPATPHNASRNLTFTIPGGGGAGAQSDSTGGCSLWPVTLAEPTATPRKWWAGVVGWGGSVEDPPNL